MRSVSAAAAPVASAIEDFGHPLTESGHRGFASVGETRDYRIRLHEAVQPSELRIRALGPANDEFLIILVTEAPADLHLSLCGMSQQVGYGRKLQIELICQFLKLFDSLLPLRT